jgi:glycosyltransferase involved in cell wall biosynthesis
MVYNYDYYNPRNGGGIRYTHNLINYLLKKDIEVTLMGVDLSNEKSNNKNDDDNSKVDTIYVLKDSDNALKFFIKLFLKAPFLKFEENSIIHAHRTYFLLPFIIFHPKIPKVVTLHMKPLEFVRVEYPQYFKIVDKIHKIIDGFCVKHIATLVAINQEVLEAYIKRYPWIKDKVVLIKGSGIDLEKFKPLKNKKELRKKYRFNMDDKIILFAGRLEKIKNLDFLIKSFAIAVKKESNIKLVIVGRGTEYENLVDLTKNLNLENKVIFVGEVSPDKMVEIYNIADVFALTSLSEASPTVVKEALACGIPVISTNVGDVKEVINDLLLGEVVDTYDKKIFAEVLIRVLNVTRPNYFAMKNCRRRIYQFSFENVVEKYLRVYKRIGDKLDHKNK